MRTLTALLAASLAACSHSTGQPPPAESQVLVSRGDGTTIAEVQLRRDAYVGEERVAVQWTRLWDWLPEVLKELGLPEPVEDPRMALVTVGPFPVVRQLGRERLARYLDCGTDVTGELANTLRVRLGVRTWLEAVSSSETIIRTQLTAEAVPVEGRGGAFPCTSRGELERRIAELLRVRTR